MGKNSDYVINKLRKITKTVGAGGVLFVYYSGHGNNQYWHSELACGGDSYITDEQLKSCLNANADASATVVMLTDACFSGSILNLKYKWEAGWKDTPRLQGTGPFMVSMSACSDSEKAASDPGVGGLFTCLWLKTLGKHGWWGNNIHNRWKTLCWQVTKQRDKQKKPLPWLVAKQTKPEPQSWELVDHFTNKLFCSNRECPNGRYKHSVKSSRTYTPGMPCGDNCSGNLNPQKRPRRDGIIMPRNTKKVQYGSQHPELWSTHPFPVTKVTLRDILTGRYHPDRV